MGTHGRLRASVPGMRTAPVPARLICALLLAALLALRSLAPVGFMPSFDHGSVTIIACPDTGGFLTAPTGHHHGDRKSLHQECPYAAAGGPASLGLDVAPLLGVLVLATAILLGRTFLFLEKGRTHERPPLRGPPLPA